MIQATRLTVRYISIKLVAVGAGWPLGTLTLGFLIALLALAAMSSIQPALLYLVPAVLLASVGQALVRGEFGALLAFKDEEEEKKDEKMEEKKDKKKD